MFLDRDRHIVWTGGATVKCFLLEKSIRDTITAHTMTCSNSLNFCSIAKVELQLEF